MNRCYLAVLALLAFTLFAPAADWLRFRGPEGSAVSNDEKVPTEWGDTKNLKWKLKLPATGRSSPIIIGDKVFVTAGTSGGEGTRRQLICVDRAKGEIAWTREVTSAGGGGRGGRGGFPGGGRGGFGGGRGGFGGGGNHSGPAASTPVSDGERVYVFFGDAGLYAYDLKGEKLWNKSAGNESNSMFGSASSPVLYKDLVIVTAGNESASIYAFDKKTGEQKWKTEAGPLTRCYGSPVVVPNPEGKDELLISVTGEVWSLNPETGKLNWYCETATDGNVCTSLIVADGIAYAIGGGGGGATGGRTALKIGGKDDVSKTNVLWSERRAPYVPSPVLYEGHLYTVNRGVVSCVDARTGREVGTARVGGDHYASPMVVNGKLLLVSRRNGTAVLEASPKLTKLATNTLGDRTNFDSSPAVSDGQLFLRSDEYLYCIAAD